jgi:hypothetical protein
MNVKLTPEYEAAMNDRSDRWVPACGGHETVQHYASGRRLLYCFNHATEKHAYLDVDTDTILSDDEARFACGRF